MKNILVIGATGQIGSELTLELRKRYGDDHVVAGYIPSAMPKGELKASGPSAIADVTDRQSIEVVARQFKIDTIYNLAALLSVVAESRPAMAWKIGIDGLWNVLEVAREYNCAVFTPSSHRLVRRSHASCKDTAGHYPASAYHVWRDKSDD